MTRASRSRFFPIEGSPYPFGEPSPGVVAAAVRALDAAGESGASQRIETIDILRNTLSDDAVDLLRQGLLGSGAAGDADADDTLQGDPPMRAPRATTKTKSGEKARAGRSSSGDVDDATPARRAATAAHRRKEAQIAKERAARLRLLERDARAARARVATVEREVERARAAVAEAEAALEDASARAEDARAEVVALEGRAAGGGSGLKGGVGQPCGAHPLQPLSAGLRLRAVPSASPSAGAAHGGVRVDRRTAAGMDLEVEVVCGGVAGVADVPDHLTGRHLP